MFQSAPLMRGATVAWTSLRRSHRVSIRAPHARGDEPSQSFTSPTHVSIRAPHARGDPHRQCVRQTSLRFNPRPSCEGRPESRTKFSNYPRVSIRAPHARGDGLELLLLEEPDVSIRAPHARGDQLSKYHDNYHTSFNPRPSCEGRPEARDDWEDREPFQSAPLMRGATVVALGLRRAVMFQSAPLMRGATKPPATLKPPLACFNPRPSCEGRLASVRRYLPAWEFQSAPLMRGATLKVPVWRAFVHVSIRAPHARGDLGPARPLPVA